ncbi:MAG TPA: hypothetical protein VN906_05180 [Candidatus Sulfotelmatobacter sp.]|nr:hypothetical protein [Candidatus Sulfotelmatobacter sp.]
MEARADVGRTGLSKAFTGAVLVLIAVGLGLMLAMLAANLGGRATTHTTVTHSAPGGAVQIYRPIRSGAQIDNSGPVAPTPGFDAKSVREGFRQ